MLMSLSNDSSNIVSGMTDRLRRRSWGEKAVPHRPQWATHWGPVRTLHDLTTAVVAPFRFPCKV